MECHLQTCSRRHQRQDTSCSISPGSSQDLHGLHSVCSYWSIFSGHLLQYTWILSFFHSENLSLKKSTRISSNFQISKDSSTRAVDGNKEQRMPECTMTTSGQRQAWWQVDLGVEQSVSQIRVLYQESTWPFFYSTIHPKNTPKEKHNVQRSACVWLQEV